MILKDLQNRRIARSLISFVVFEDTVEEEKDIILLNASRNLRTLHLEITFDTTVNACDVRDL